MGYLTYFSHSFNIAILLYSFHRVMIEEVEVLSRVEKEIRKGKWPVSAVKALERACEKLKKYTLEQLIKPKIILLLKGHQDLLEIRNSHGGVSYRVLFTIIDKTCWLLRAFKKKTEETPPNEIAVAAQRAKAVREGLSIDK